MEYKEPYGATRSHMEPLKAPKDIYLSPKVLKMPVFLLETLCFSDIFSNEKMILSTLLYNFLNKEGSTVEKKES